MGKQSSTDEPDQLPPLIVYTPTGRDATLIVRLLASNNLPCRACGREAELLAAAETGVGPLLIAEEGLSEAGGSQLCQLLDAQPAWSDLPVILLRQAGSRTGVDHDRLIRRSSVRWLRRPIDSHSLVVLVRLAGEARRRQQQVASLLDEQVVLNEQLTRHTDQLRDLTVELIEAEDHERARLADLLHDDLQGLLVAASLHLAAAEKHIGDNSSLRDAIDRTRELLKDAQESSRNLSHELFPAALRRGDLHGLLKWLESHAERMFGVDLQVTSASHLDTVEPVILRFCYRAIREILCNTAKHAGVTRASLKLRCHDGHLELTIADEGVGFDPAHLDQAADAGNMGLLAIRERIESLRGSMLVDSQPGAGSRITLIVPVDKARTAEHAGSDPQIVTLRSAIRNVGAAQPPIAIDRE